MLKALTFFQSHFIFLKNKKGTPSIETAGIIAFVTIAILAALGTMGDTIKNVFDTVTQDLQDQINN